MGVGLQPFEMESADYLLVKAAAPAGAAAGYEAILGFFEGSLEMTTITDTPFCLTSII